MHAAVTGRHRGQWWLALWPGLAPLWLVGAWSGLALALSFAALLNLVLITTLVYSELVTPPVRIVAWLSVAGFWAASTLASFRWRAPRQAHTSVQDLFPHGLSEYLQGNWLETEMICQRMLEHDPADAEARLLLASAQRRSGRAAAARQTLLALARQPEAARWQAEIQQELARLDAQPSADVQPALPADLPPADLPPAGLPRADLPPAAANKLPKAA